LFQQTASSYIERYTEMYLSGYSQRTQRGVGLRSISSYLRVWRATRRIVAQPEKARNKMPKPAAATATDLLTTEQVIERLLDANLRRVAATCVLPAVRSGDCWCFRRADLDEWIRRQASPVAERRSFTPASKPADTRPS